MKLIQRKMVRLLTVGLLAFPGAAWGATLYTQVTGVNSAMCGDAALPCRTISQAITNAAAGDTIAVGPGQYGSVNSDTDLLDAGEESSGVAGKMIVVNKELALIAPGGTASVIISGAGVTGLTVLVSIESNGVVFGKKGKGFVVSGLTSATGAGVVVASTTSDVTVGGNVFRSNTLDSLVLNGSGNTAKENSLEDKVRVLGTANVLQKNTLRNCSGEFRIDGSGHVVAKNQIIDGSVILEATSSAVLVKGNNISGNCGSAAVQVLGGPDHVFSANTITGRTSSNFSISAGSDLQFLNNVTRGGLTGFYAAGPSTNLTFIGNSASGHASDGFFIQPFPVTNVTFVKNVAVGNAGLGISINQALTATVVDNSVIGNGNGGIFINGAAVLNGNNIFGNGAKATATNPNCGLVQIGISLANATDNFWGAAAGPGADPADDICINTLYVDATSPAPAAFKVKAAKANPY